MPSGLARRVMVLDDEEDIVATVADALSIQLQGDVEGCTDPLDALRRLAQQDFDLVFVDFKMPDMDGLQFIDRSRELGSRARFVMMTAFPDQNLAIRAINEGKVAGFLVKPLDFDGVLAMAKRHLAARGQEVARQRAFARATGRRDGP